jgi:hypothetical protein
LANDQPTNLTESEEFAVTTEPKARDLVDQAT